MRELFLAGVYNETYEVRTDGGPICASETTLGFKYASNMILAPIHITMLIIGAKYLARTFE